MVKFSFSLPDDVVEVSRRLRAAGGEAYLVGGAVRDLLRGVPAGDFDLATNLLPEQTAKSFPSSVPTGIEHGTITVWLNDRCQGKGFEITTYRGEGTYSDGRHPDQVIFMSRIEDDLARRDFTINAMALNPLTLQLVDPFDGQKDLIARLIRAVGDPKVRFCEDGLRSMRAIRFATCLDFNIDANTLAAISETLHTVEKVSIERLRDEFLKLLTAEKPSRGIELMRTTGLLAIILPELLEGVDLHQNHFHMFDVYQHTLAATDAAEGRTARLAALFHDIAKPRTAQQKPDIPGEHTFYRHDSVGAALTDVILRRLKFSNDEREKIVGLVAHHMFWYDPAWSDGSVRRFVRRIGTENLDDIYELRRADIIARGKGEDPSIELEPLQQRVVNVLEQSRAMKITDLAVNGKDVMEVLRVAPSPRVGEVLEQLLERVLEDPSLNHRERLLSLISEYTTPNSKL